MSAIVQEPNYNVEYHHKYYLEHRQKYIDRMMEPIYCDVCKKNITTSQKKRHLISKQHKSNLYDQLINQSGRPKSDQ